jgi:hypothetical protein
MKTILPVSRRAASQWRILILAGTLSAVTLAFSGGCLAVAAAGGAGATYYYIHGTMESWLEAGLAPSVRAANAAVRELGFVKISETGAADATTLTVRTPADEKITITLAPVDSKLTRVRIRAGLLGDRELSQAVLAKIRAAL